ncbi:DUF4362 domain-containing protein [Filibacter tadaridae]|uniref:DUF4362 domain-containing protein n=1 Tax=Filibacter tadaridae TaxID=2483811 RepID=A0A3P5XF59_9BACL|nr:DUF4362 domain-containing protein [Filibacter tadaridae]VDC28863.1 hypothetical protein FILTAD_01877 [Filibacter tadaridae]
MRRKATLLLIAIMGIVLGTACSYDSEKALKNGDVVNMNGPVYNFVMFEIFLNSIETKNADTVRITNYSVEGDPIFYDLNYDGSSIDLEVDQSKDKYKGDGPAKVQMSCTHMATDDGQQVVTYTLEGCDHQSADEGFIVLSVLKEEEHDH